MAAKLTKEYIIQEIEKRNFIYIDHFYVKWTLKINFKDEEDYFYSMSFQNFMKQGVRKFDVSNSFTLKNINKWIEENNKNFILLSNEYKGNCDKMELLCTNENCGEKFLMSWAFIRNHQLCPFCQNERVGSKNNLLKINPVLAQEWDYDKNFLIRPENIFPQSNKKFWWKCANGHSWLRSPNGRQTCSCPHCANRIASEINNFELFSPDLLDEWDYGKNLKLPSQYTRRSGKRVWWRCKKGHEWEATIDSRADGYGCPTCGLSKSKGEIKISKFLDKKNIVYTVQKKYPNLIGTGGAKLSYDFYLESINLLIEYQGEQHDKPIEFFKHEKGTADELFQIQQEHDSRKRTYAAQNNMQLLEIWYYDFDRIEEILSEALSLSIS